MATGATSACSSSSVAFHRAAWVRGVEDDRGREVLGRLGRRPGRQVSLFLLFVCLIFPFFIFFSVFCLAT